MKIYTIRLGVWEAITLKKHSDRLEVVCAGNLIDSFVMIKFEDNSGLYDLRLKLVD